MELPGIYFSNDVNQRLIVIDDERESYVILNATVMSSNELCDIIEWCHDKKEYATYTNAGIVKFSDRTQLLQFMLVWG
jgi:hypothetical protein